MKKMFRTLAVGLTMLLTLTGLAAAADTPIPINIGWLPGTYYAYYVARDLKLFQKHGLEPNYVKFTAGPPMFAAFQSGGIDVSWGGAVPAIIGAAQGVPLSIIALESVTKNALVVNKDSHITKIADLAGKTIGTVKGSGAYFAMVKLLDAAGLSGKYKFLDMQMPSLLPALSHGDVDGIWVWEPWASMAKGRRIADELNIFGAYPGAPIMARTGWLKTKPEAVRRFLAAMHEAQVIYHRDPSIAIKDMANEFGISERMATDIYKQDPKPTFEQEVTPGNPYGIIGQQAAQVKYFQDIADFFYHNGFIKTRPDMSQVFVTQPIADFMKTQSR